VKAFLRKKVKMAVGQAGQAGMRRCDLVSAAVGEDETLGHIACR
jgi:hypothetical protein